MAAYAAWEEFQGSLQSLRESLSRFEELEKELDSIRSDPGAFEKWFPELESWTKRAGDARDTVVERRAAAYAHGVLWLDETLLDLMNQQSESMRRFIETKMDTDGSTHLASRTSGKPPVGSPDAFRSRNRNPELARQIRSRTLGCLQAVAPDIRKLPRGRGTAYMANGKHIELHVATTKSRPRMEYWWLDVPDHAWQSVEPLFVIAALPRASLVLPYANLKDIFDNLSPDNKVNKRRKFKIFEPREGDFEIEGSGGARESIKAFVDAYDLI